jgi:succinyl-CoA synthetase beta subunit
MTVDRDTGKLAMIASSEGGVEIEQVSKEAPEKIITEKIDPAVGLHDYRLRYLAEKLGIADVKGFIRTGLGMYKLFCEKDCSLVEINPLAELADGTITALDAKVNFDDNAMYRHPEILALTDPNEENPRELEANKYGLNYVSLGGNVGCLVNGAGLAMATMDMIHYAGAVPANFLDVGGTATTEKVTKAFEIILSDQGVQAILVNIFGGLIKCDMIAEGIIEAAKNSEIKVPIVARLEGTNVEKGKQLLLNSGMNIIPASSLKEGAEICAKIVKEAN